MSDKILDHIRAVLEEHGTLTPAEAHSLFSLYHAMAFSLDSKDRVIAELEADNKAFLKWFCDDNRHNDECACSGSDGAGLEDCDCGLAELLNGKGELDSPIKPTKP